MPSKHKAKFAIGFSAGFFVFWFIDVLLLGFLTGTKACFIATALEPIRAQFPLWCLEFWIFRYQSLIGAFATLAAGAFAFWAVQRQTAAGRVSDQRFELAAIETMLSRNGWAKELADLIDDANYSKFYLYIDGDLDSVKDRIAAKQSEFFSDRPRIMFDDDARWAMDELEIAAGRAHLEIVMTRHSYVCENIVKAKDDDFDRFDFVGKRLAKCEEEREMLRNAMTVACKHLNNRARQLVNAIRRVDNL